MPGAGPPPRSGNPLQPPPGQSAPDREIGQEGIPRFFQAPLSKEMSWLLPFALIAIPVLLLSSKPTFPLSKNHQTLVLWGGWLATGRPVLYMGGFSGSDPVVSADDVAALVADGELRYVMLGGERGMQQEISRWVRSYCTVVPVTGHDEPAARPGRGGATLYQCDV